MNAMANQRLAGKVAFITGGASGVGKATALRLAGEGANVVVSDVNEEGGRAVAAEIGAQSCFVQHDVTDEAQWSVAIAAAQAPAAAAPSAAATAAPRRAMRRRCSTTFSVQASPNASTDDSTSASNCGPGSILTERRPPSVR